LAGAERVLFVLESRPILLVAVAARKQNSMQQPGFELLGLLPELSLVVAMFQAKCSWSSGILVSRNLAVIALVAVSVVALVAPVPAP
jgi:hypothetical protein